MRKQMFVFASTTQDLILVWGKVFVFKKERNGNKDKIEEKR